MRNVWLRSSFVLGLSVLAGCTPKYAHYGNPMTLTDRSTMSIDRLLADPDAYDGKYVRVAGTVNSVCEDRGCWLILVGTDESRHLFVKFTGPIEGRLIPLEAAGHRATVEGTVELAETSAGEARHDREDAGAADADEESTSIAGPQRQLRMTSAAASIEGLR